MIYKIKNESITASINDLGAELVSVINNANKEFIVQPSDIWIGQSKNLFPNVGVAKHDYTIIKGEKYPMYQHGFAKTMVFEVAQQSEDSIEFSLKSNKDTKVFLPYDFEFKIKFTVVGNQIEQVYTVINNFYETMYFGVACHTGFASGKDSYVEFFENNELVEIIRENMKYLTGEEVEFKTENGKIPVTPKYFKDGARILRNFKDKSITLVNPSLESEVKIEFYDFRYITLWTSEDAETFLCMMPWCALPDSKTTNHIFEEKQGNVKLEAGKTFIAKQIFTFTDTQN